MMLRNNSNRPCLHCQKLVLTDRLKALSIRPTSKPHNTSTPHLGDGLCNGVAGALGALALHVILHLVRSARLKSGEQSMHRIKSARVGQDMNTTKPSEVKRFWRASQRTNTAAVYHVFQSAQAAQQSGALAQLLHDLRAWKARGRKWRVGEKGRTGEKRDKIQGHEPRWS